MAWTAPITFVSGTVLTASLLNTYLRDNLNQTAPGLVDGTTRGGYFVGTGSNAIVERQPAVDVVAASQTSSSTTYVDLATAGPAVTVDTSTNALVMLYCSISNNTSDGQSNMSYAISGATTQAAANGTAITFDAVPTGNNWRMSSVNMETVLTAGSNTFTAKYRVDGATTGTWADRMIIVIPF